PTRTTHHPSVPNDTHPTDMPTPSLHDALPISQWLPLQQLSYQPSGCFLRRSVPSSLHGPVRRRIQRTVRQSAYVLKYLSYRRKPDRKSTRLNSSHVSISYPGLSLKTEPTEPNL